MIRPSLFAKNVKLIDFLNFYIFQDVEVALSHIGIAVAYESPDDLHRYRYGLCQGYIGMPTAVWRQPLCANTFQCRIIEIIKRLWINRLSRPPVGLSNQTTGTTVAKQNRVLSGTLRYGNYPPTGKRLSVGNKSATLATSDRLYYRD